MQRASTEALGAAHRSAEALIAVPGVQAVALGGSQVTGLADEGSDADLYVLYSGSLDASSLHGALAPLAVGPVQRITQWGEDDLWTDRATGIGMEAMLWPADWARDQLDRVLVRHEASLGYTTAFWHTIGVAKPLQDPGGHFAALQTMAASPYPPELQRAIVALNHPVLRGLPPSYRQQLIKAETRGDAISRNHRAAAFLASFFDCLFAANRQPHPGEKRLLEHAARLPHAPPTLAQDIRAFLRAAAEGEGVAEATDRLADSLDVVLHRLDLLPD